mmetsp:Transcript_4260/g.11615  ORF Transcript_4260/g.11615 Transcript_4260/m.11615 type:complete len:231 (+) Transcript_4260:367-1059(+)|eukprot:CAMPEP_0168743642 /NCGR_PEP_ID=MMETSP0724-20121128/13682_1 /TAXON_ID=265536 /ORGANISM="Amphiprora sp., Strain CCMP467" /LENGTH=230 /DNA_ID=CAMNT_0008791279 /DNA_START=355 /DNA_END=1047 /DNA_ORIENTATION=+
MKFFAPFAVLLTITGSADAFAPSINAHQSSTALFSTLPPSSEWKGYYTNYDDSKVVKTDADVGFDPLGFSDTKAGLFFMREAEIKHCRLAMLAAASWPIAELFDKPLANLLGQPVIVDATDRNPSLLNGGLEKISPIYWAAILVAAAAVDLTQINMANTDPTYTPGNLGWDPLGLYPKDEAGKKSMLAKELRNGRLAMIAITAFAAQEYVTQSGIVDQTPIFFKPFAGLL